MTRERRKAAPRRSSTSASNTAADDDFASDEDDLPHPSHETSVSKRREEVRKQRIESEQRRRDELRDGYRRLKDVLPVSNQKSSKVSLLDRGELLVLFYLRAPSHPPCNSGHLRKRVCFCID